MLSNLICDAGNSLVSEDRIRAAKWRGVRTGNRASVVECHARLADAAADIGRKRCRVLEPVVLIQHHVVAVQIPTRGNRTEGCTGRDSIDVILPKGEFEFSRETLMP